MAVLKKPIFSIHQKKYFLKRPILRWSKIDGGVGKNDRILKEGGRGVQKSYDGIEPHSGHV